MENKQKAKRKLKGFDFAKEGAAVALVGPSVGGPANGIPTLIAKANNFSPEFIQKMQQIQVTYELPEFLRKVFGMYYEDAEVLAKMLGYVEPEDEETEDYDDWYENYIEEKLQSFTIIKALYEAKNLPDALSKLTEQDYLDVLQDQAMVEKALKKELDKETEVSKADTSTKVENTKVEASASKKKNPKKETNFAFIIRHKFRYTYCISRIDINLREIIDSRACMVRMHMRGDQRNRLIRDGSHELIQILDLCSGINQDRFRFSLDQIQALVRH
jgi:hypothetical protein